MRGCFSGCTRMQSSPWKQRVQPVGSEDGVNGTHRHVSSLSLPTLFIINPMENLQATVVGQTFEKS